MTDKDIIKALEEIVGKNLLKPCPMCKEVPTIGYACGEYFILPISKIVGTCFCSSFTEMHSNKEQEIEAWNRRVDNGNL